MSVTFSTDASLSLKVILEKTVKLYKKVLSIST